MKIIIKIIVIFGTLFTTSYVNGNNSNLIKFVAKIDSIQKNKTEIRFIDGVKKLELADKIFFTEYTPCGYNYQPINRYSTNLSINEYNDSFWENLVFAIDDEQFLLFTSESCDIEGTPFITDIQVCNNDICDNQYLPRSDIIWVSFYNESYYQTAKRDAKYYINLPIIFDKYKKIWKIQGWYAATENALKDEKPVLAFEGYTDTNIYHDFQSIKFVDDLTRYYYSGNKLSVIPHNKAGLIDGILVRYYDNEKSAVSEIVPYVNGKKDGKARYYHQNGVIESQPIFSQGLHIDGKCYHYFSNGKLHRQHTYLNGQYDGEYIDYYENGQILEKSTYHNGHKIGISESFYVSGKIYTISQYDKNGHLHGEYVHFEETGNKKFNYLYEHGRKIEYNTWNNGIKTEQSFFCLENGELDGKHQIWYEDGQIKSIEYYNKGQKDGIFQEWYPNNQIKLEKVYKNNKIISAILWNKEGSKISEKFYDPDNSYYRTGVWREWYNNGSPSSLKTYSNNKLNGLSQSWYYNGLVNFLAYYDENGDLISKTIFIYNKNNQIMFENIEKRSDDGFIVEQIEYDENGNKKIKR